MIEVLLHKQFKRKMNAFEKRSLDLIYQQFVRTYDKEWFNAFSHNLRLYNASGIDCADYQRWYRYYKQKLEGKL
jgi:hypothetical protein